MHKITIFILTAFWVPWSAAEDTLNTETHRTRREIALEEARVANSVNNFGYKLILQMMKDRKNDNIVISPTGIAGLLAMSLLGTVGKTYDEIAESLGFSQDILENRKNHEHFGELLKNLNSNISASTLYANAIFVDVKTRIRQLYQDYVYRVYQGEALSTDFTNTLDTTNLINQWVNNHTNGKIENFLKQSIPESTRVVLLSALHFSGQWEKPFIEVYTTQMPFKTPSGEVQADLMLNLGHFKYLFSESDGLHMIALPYNDSVTTMYALKPRIPNQLNLSQLMERLDYKKIDDLINQMTKRECVLRFPKMELANRFNLEHTLKDLGVHSMFTPGEANFVLMVESNSTVNSTQDEIIAGINSGENKARSFRETVNRLPNPGIHVDSVLHDVKMSINEFGTEAVAATSAILARSSERFYGDSPFYMFIRNEHTKLVTFSALINNPTI